MLTMNINRTTPSSLPVTLQFGGRQTYQSSYQSHHPGGPSHRSGGPTHDEMTPPNNPPHFGSAGMANAAKRFIGLA
jgi:hypothetical protein